MGYILKPSQAIIDFELAAKKAYEKVSVGIIVKGCLFHFWQSIFAQVENQSDTKSDWFSTFFPNTERVKCSYYPKLYTKREMTKHINKQQTTYQYIIFSK